jgi:two-component system response regulator (stage 0 sporulation protein F)
MKKILLVDDEENIHIVYRAEFEDIGYQVISAVNGEEGLAKFQDDKPDLVILDILMPGMSGVEVLRKMKMLDPTIPMILSIAYTQFKHYIGTCASDAYIVKSGDSTDLKNTVRNLLEKDGCGEPGENM